MWNLADMKTLTCKQNTLNLKRLKFDCICFSRMYFSLVGIFIFQHVKKLSITPLLFWGEKAICVKINSLYILRYVSSFQNLPTLMRGWYFSSGHKQRSLMTLLEGWCGSCDTSALPWQPHKHLCPHSGEVFRGNIQCCNLLHIRDTVSLYSRCKLLLGGQSELHVVMRSHIHKECSFAVWHDVCEIGWQEVETLHDVLLRE